jgi:hypothetical protein
MSLERRLCGNEKLTQKEKKRAERGVVVVE